MRLLLWHSADPGPELQDHWLGSWVNHTYRYRASELLLYEDEISSVEGPASAATLLPPRLRKHVTTAQIVS